MRSAWFIAFGLVGAVVAGLVALDGLSPDEQAPAQLVVGVLPDQEPEVLRARFAPLVDHLAQRSGHEFILMIPDDYGHLLSLFESGKIDLAYFGGLTFVQARQSAGARPLVMRGIDTRFTTTFVVRNESPWTRCVEFACEDLKGATLVFGSRLSTSGHLMPRFFLQAELGLVPEEFFAQVRFSGAHDRTVFQVETGLAEVGAVNTVILAQMQADGRIPQGALLRIWETPPYADYVWATRATLDDGIVATLRDAFLSLDGGDPQAAPVLAALQARGFVPASDRDFEPLALVAADFGLIAPR